MAAQANSCYICCSICYSILVFVALYVIKVLFFSPKVPTIHVELTPEEASDDGVKTKQVESCEIRDASEPDMIRCFDPATMQFLGKVPAMNENEVNQRVLKAKEAQVEWAKTSFCERKRVLLTLQKYIIDHQDDICRVAARDSGKPKVDALLGEVITTCEKIRTIIAHGEKWLKRDYRSPGPAMMYKNAYVEYHPLGVLGVIAPWNYPFHNLYNHIISGIFAGNAVVCKVSELTSWSTGYYGRIIREVLVATGHNPNLVQIITGFAETGVALVKSPDVDKIIFTGSPQVGKLVMRGCSESLKPVVLELGGKDPMVLCDDCDVDQVIPMVLRGVYQNAGQNCCGAERLIVYEKIYDEFIDKIVPKVKALRQGLPLAAGTDVGAMVMPRQLEIIQELVDDAVSKGAKLLCGGKRNASLGQGLFYEPTILADLNSTMRITQEEVFGPVLCIIKVPNNDESACLEIVNCCDYGLGSSVFSKCQTRATRIGEKIRAGMTTINDFGVNYLIQSLPFGGVKHSGFDRFAGPEGLRACCLMKSVVVDKFSFMRTTIPKVLQYPIAPQGFNFGKGMVQTLYGLTIKEKLFGVISLARAALAK